MFGSEANNEVFHSQQNPGTDAVTTQTESVINQSNLEKDIYAQPFSQEAEELKLWVAWGDEDPEYTNEEQEMQKQENPVSNPIRESNNPSPLQKFRETQVVVSDNQTEAWDTEAVNQDGWKKNYFTFFKTVRSQIGKRYNHSAWMTWIDCSQLVMKWLGAAGLVWKGFNVKGKLANSLYLYYTQNKNIKANTDETSFRKGDLIFWYEPAGNANWGWDHSDQQMYHVALCAWKSFQKNGRTYCKTIESTVDWKWGVQYFPAREMRAAVDYAAVPRESVYSTVLENASFSGIENIDPSSVA